MKKAIIAIMALFVSCGSKLKPEQKFITRNLPSGIEVKILNEDHSPVDGKYSLEFSITNNTGKIMKMPALHGVLFLNGEKKGEPDGGADHELQVGETAPAHFNWIIADGKPDSVVFYYDGIK